MSRGSSASTPGVQPPTRAISSITARTAATVIRTRVGSGTVTAVITKTKLHGKGGPIRTSPKYSTG